MAVHHIYHYTESPEFLPVEPMQAVACRHPDQTITVLDHMADHALPEALFYTKGGYKKGLCFLNALAERIRLKASEKQ